MNVRRCTRTFNPAFTALPKFFSACPIQQLLTCGHWVVSLLNFSLACPSSLAPANTTSLPESSKCLGMRSLCLEASSDSFRMPPLSMLNTGKQASQFFDSYETWNSTTNQTEKRYRLKTIEQYSREHNTNEQPGKQYFKATTLPDIINTAPMPTSKSSRQGHELEKGM